MNSSAWISQLLTTHGLDMPQLQAHQDRSLENRITQERFQARYVSSIEHCLRLVTERLQLNLDKRDGVEAGDSSTWRMSPQDLHALTESLALLDSINRLNRDK